MKLANFHPSETVQGVGKRKKSNTMVTIPRILIVSAFEMESDCALRMPKIAGRLQVLELYKVEHTEFLMFYMHARKKKYACENITR